MDLCVSGDAEVVHQLTSAENLTYLASHHRHLSQLEHTPTCVKTTGFSSINRCKSMVKGVFFKHLSIHTHAGEVLWPWPHLHAFHIHILAHWTARDALCADNISYFLFRSVHTDRFLNSETDLGLGHNRCEHCAACQAGSGWAVPGNPPGFGGPVCSSVSSYFYTVVSSTFNLCKWAGSGWVIKLLISYLCCTCFCLFNVWLFHI